jgi:hypothetical protein
MENKKVIELKVLEDEFDSGVSAIALVDQPATEKYWIYMRNEKFVDPKAGESQSDFMGRCVPAMINEGKDQDQAVAMCISMYEQKHSKQKFADYPWDQCIADAKARGLAEENANALCGWIRWNMGDEKFDFDPSGLPPYIEQAPKKKKTKMADDKDLADACDEGYEAYGLKELNGRMVPNCVPIKAKKLRKVEKRSTFSSAKNDKITFAVEKDQQILVGAAMIPDLEIFRKDEDGNPYYVKFSKDTIAGIQQKFMAEMRNRETNLDHNDNVSGGSYVFESWLVEDPKTDKANTVYHLDVPAGTWMVKMKVTDPKVWAEVKAGKYKGFSIEGNFIDKQDYDKIQDEKKALEQIMRILNS